jgi:hypothetical protein
MRTATFDLHRGTVSEWALPLNLRELLQTARTTHPDHEVICVSYHVQENGREIARMGPGSEALDLRTACSTRLRPKDLIVWSVSATETTFESVRTVTHVLIARIQVRSARAMR